MIVFGNAGVNTLTTADTETEVQSVDKLDTIHRFDVFDIWADGVTIFHLLGNPAERFVHLLRSHFLVVLLKHFLHSGNLIRVKFEQRFHRGNGGGKAGPPFVLRGAPSAKMESVTDAGATEAQAAVLQKAVTFKARIAKDK